MRSSRIMFEETEYRRARRRAADLDISLAEYIRGLVREDLDRSRSAADDVVVLEVGDGPDPGTPAHEGTYIGEAFAARLEQAEHLP